MLGRNNVRGVRGSILCRLASFHGGAARKKQSLKKPGARCNAPTSFHLRTLRDLIGRFSSTKIAILAISRYSLSLFRDPEGTRGRVNERDNLSSSYTSIEFRSIFANFTANEEPRIS